MFKVNNKVLCLYYSLWTYSIPCSSVSIVMSTGEGQNLLRKTLLLPCNDKFEQVRNILKEWLIDQAKALKRNFDYHILVSL